jgi:acetyltransferase EpsM
VKIKSKNLVIIGNGKHAKVIKDEVNKKKEYKIVDIINLLINDSTKKQISSLEKLKKINKNFFTVIAFGRGDIREKIVHLLNKLKIKIKWAKIVSKNTIISSSVKIGDGSVIISGSIINTGSIIGKHCLINTGSIIDHDNEFKDFSGCGPGTITGGSVKVGKKSYIGIGSIIKNNVLIDNSVIIGSSSNIIKNCDKESIYFGNPAKKIRKKRKNENYLK